MIKWYYRPEGAFYQILFISYHNVASPKLMQRVPSRRNEGVVKLRKIDCPYVASSMLLI